MSDHDNSAEDRQPSTHAAGEGVGPDSLRETATPMAGSDGTEEGTGAASASDGTAPATPPVRSDWWTNRRSAREIVPEIGEGRRWYDIAYKVITWLLGGRPRRLLPRWVRVRLNYAQISLHAINDRDQYSVWPEDDLNRFLNVPADEHVSFPAIWVVELFPPSRYEALLRASKRRGWNKGRDIMQRDRNDEILAASRGGRGYSWWRLANITDPRSPYGFGDDVTQRLPSQFVSVELRGITVGPSLTAVVGLFTLDENAIAALDEVWHSNHEPSVVRRGPTLQAQDRLWSGLRNTQRARQEIHDAARSWMRESLPGFFATSSEPQLVLDLCLTDLFDPTAAHRDRADRDEFRALGLTRFETEHRVSPRLPGLVLLPADGLLCADLEARNVWTLWGQRTVVKDAFGDSLAGRGSDLGRAIASALDHAIRKFAVALALTGYVDAAKAQHAAMRDNATVQHHRFSTRRLRKLRRALLGLSIDLSGMERDTTAFWSRKDHFEPIMPFHHIEAPGHAEWLRENNIEVHDPIDFNERIRDRQQAELRSLVEADETYRDILSTVSALGASADSSRLGRLALLVAAASLVLAGVTLWVTLDDGAEDQPADRPADRPRIEQRR